MSRHGGSTRRWSIGELAAASGVTVRMLRHYDEIGLVTASERTPAGHRRYTETDVRRLYRVRALRQLGLSLEEIASALGRSTEDLTALRDLLVTQLAGLEVQASRIAELRLRVRGLLEHLEHLEHPDGAVLPTPEQFLGTLEPVLPMEPLVSGRQRDALARRATELGEGRIQALKSEWLGLVAQLRRHAKDHTPVDDPRVQALAARWQAIGAAFRTGDARIDGQIQTAAVALWRDRGRQISRRLSDRVGWLEADDVAAVADYLQRAGVVGAGSAGHGSQPAGPTSQGVSVRREAPNDGRHRDPEQPGAAS